jgi:hypothetical protein
VKGGRDEGCALDTWRGQLGGVIYEIKKSKRGAALGGKITTIILAVSHALFLYLNLYLRN